MQNYRRRNYASASIKAAALSVCALFLLSGCATVTNPAPDDIYTLSALETMSVLKNIKDEKSQPGRSPITCYVGNENKVEVYVSNDMFMPEEYWVKRTDEHLYLGVQNDYSRSLFQFENVGILAFVEPTYFTAEVEEDTWYGFWLDEVTIEETGANKLAEESSVEVDDELLDMLGTTLVKMFLEPIYAFLNTYYGGEEEVGEEELDMPTATLAFNDEQDCNNSTIAAIASN